MVFPHLTTIPDANYPTVPDGRPIVDTTDPNQPDGYPATLYYADDGLAAMTQDLHRSFYDTASANPNFAGVAPVGDAFQRAVEYGIAMGDGFYDSSGVYTLSLPKHPLDLWWWDYLHASRYGSYLSALVLFGTITKLDPWSFGASEQAAADLGIAPGDAVRLQRIASDQLIAAGISLTRIPFLHANPHASGSGP
jgi:hypothetical protein